MMNTNININRPETQGMQASTAVKLDSFTFSDDLEGIKTRASNLSDSVGADAVEAPFESVNGEKLAPEKILADMRNMRRAVSNLLKMA